VTATEYLKMCDEYFGPWERPLIKRTVASYVGSKSGSFLDALWQVTRERREVEKGPPDLNAIMRMADDAAYSMRIAAKPSWPTRGELPPPPGLATVAITQEDIDSWPSVDGETGDRWLSKAETAQALAVVYARLEGADADRKAQAAEQPARQGAT